MPVFYRSSLKATNIVFSVATKAAAQRLAWKIPLRAGRGPRDRFSPSAGDLGGGASQHKAEGLGAGSRFPGKGGDEGGEGPDYGGEKRPLSVFSVQNFIRGL